MKKNEKVSKKSKEPKNPTLFTLKVNVEDWTLQPSLEGDKDGLEILLSSLKEEVIPCLKKQLKDCK